MLFQTVPVKPKLLVGLGNTGDDIVTDSIEIIDLEVASNTCKSMPSYPMKLSSAFGGLGLQNQTMICSGNANNNKYIKNCFSLEGSEWTSSPSTNTTRVYAAVSPSPYPSKSQLFFVTGGVTSSARLNTVEVLTEQGWKTLPQTLPVTIFSHCSVLVNSTTVMVISGYQNFFTSPKTYLFNTENEIWTEGPPLKHKRKLHSCGRIKKNSQSQEFSIIVAGGYEGSYLSSVEILDAGSNEWREGPSLPFGIDEAEMVEDQNGGVVLVGGESDSYKYLDTLFQLPHGGEDAVWTKMEQKLQTGRWGHVAFLVPDNIVDCSS